MKKLSVITVTYNCAGSIGKTLESVLSQDPNLVEHIVIDGGSVDGTLDIVGQYKDRLAHFVSERDRGIYDAMNKGIAAASGEWILFLNAGDVFHEGFELSRLAFDWPAGTEFVVFPYRIDGQSAPKIPDLRMRFGMPTSHQAMFISSRAAKDTKLNSGYRVAADYEFFVKRFRLNRECVRVERDVLARVLPGGYSAAHLHVMKKEYQQIVLRNLGWKKAAVYFFWSRPSVFRIIKALLPSTLFRKLKKLL